MAPLLADEPRPAELGEVEGQGGIRHAESVCDGARRPPLPASLDEEAEQRQAMLLGERAERGDGGGRVYGTLVSIVIEMSREEAGVNPHFDGYGNKGSGR